APGYGAGLGQSDRSPDFTVIRPFLGQGFEKLFCGLLTLLREIAKRLVGVEGKSTGHAADRLILLKVNWPSCARLLPLVPRAHQRMLQDGQLVLAVANIVQ